MDAERIATGGGKRISADGRTGCADPGAHAESSVQGTGEREEKSADTPQGAGVDVPDSLPGGCSQP